MISFDCEYNSHLLRPSGENLRSRRRGDGEPLPPLSGRLLSINKQNGE